MAPFGILELVKGLFNTSYKKKGGYGPHPALKMPPLSEEIKRKRREWAEAHKDWTVEDWITILWTDETWATDGQR